MMLPEMRWMIDGVEGADSLAWNPHKWLGTIGDCSLLYVADPATWSGSCRPTRPISVPAWTAR